MTFAKSKCRFIFFTVKQWFKIQNSLRFSRFLRCSIKKSSRFFESSFGLAIFTSHPDKPLVRKKLGLIISKKFTFWSTKFHITPPKIFAKSAPAPQLYPQNSKSLRISIQRPRFLGSVRTSKTPKMQPCRAFPKKRKKWSFFGQKSPFFEDFQNSFSNYENFGCAMDL